MPHSSEESLIAFLHSLDRIPEEVPEAGTFPPGYLISLPVGREFITRGMPARYVHILLEGTCGIEKHSDAGMELTDIKRVPIQYFGLFEAVSGLDTHTATLRTMTPCKILRIPSAHYLRLIRRDSALMWLALLWLANFTKEMLARDDELLLNDSRRNILLWIYRYGAENGFPARLPIRKEELAHELNLNLRTLYRKLDELYAEDLLGRDRGKIAISPEQYQRIAREIEHL